LLTYTDASRHFWAVLLGCWANPGRWALVSGGVPPLGRLNNTVARVPLLLCDDHSPHTLV
jgi:hypothetical protein